MPIFNPYRFEGEVPPPPVVPFMQGIVESASSIVWSNDHFQTFTRINSTWTAHPYILATNLGACFAYRDADLKGWTFTIDYGATWNHMSQGSESYQFLFSDDGQYIISTGNSNNGAGAIPKYSTNYGASFAQVTSSIMHQGVYGAPYGALSRSGQYALLACRSQGYAGSSNYLGSWTGSQLDSNISGAKMQLANDNTGWCTVARSWSYDISYKHNSPLVTGGTLINRTSSNDTSGITALPNNGGFYLRDFDIDRTYSLINGVLNTNFAAEERSYAINDDASLKVYARPTDLHYFINGVDSGKILKGWAWEHQISRDGVLFVITNDRKLHVSYDQGNSWIDRTGGLDLTDYAVFAVPQWNHMSF